MNDRRALNVERLKAEVWDVLIVGGGINGAGIARDLMLRDANLKVALVEKNHFASGTSGRNSQLIHGGLRYLKYFDFGLVREALHERATLLRIAPELVRPLQFLIPCYGPWDRWFYGAGLTLYDALSGGSSIGHHRALSGAETAKLEPELERAGLDAGLLFYDGRVHSARLVLENIIDAQTRGACVANYLEVRGDQAIDKLSGEQFALRAKRFVDATGSWSKAGPLRLVRGSHLVFPRIQKGAEAIAYFDRQGRIVFLIPWGENDDLTLVGTTDVDHAGDADDVRISQGRGCVFEVDRAPVVSTVSRRAGGELQFAAAFGRADGKVGHIDKPGASDLGDGRWRASYLGWKVHHLPGDERGTGGYDHARGAVPDCGGSVGYSGRARRRSARVRKAVEREFARHLPDLLEVSTYWGYERRADAVRMEPLAREMGALLGWDEARVREEVAGFQV